MKRAIIKGFVDRARALYDERHLAEELQSIEEMCVANNPTLVSASPLWPIPSMKRVCREPW